MHSSIGLPRRTLDRNFCFEDARQFLFHRRWQEADHSYQPRHFSYFRHHQSRYFIQAAIEIEFGVEGIALSWLQSYLTDRSQFVKLDRHCSKTIICSSGVPQGSVLGPLLFVIYVSPVCNLITSNGVSHHQYADHTQLFLAIKASYISADQANLESCSPAVKGWFAVNILMLNADKSDVMLIYIKFIRTRMQNIS